MSATRLGGAGQKVATHQVHRLVARILEAVAQPRPDNERVALGEGRGLALVSAAAPGEALHGERARRSLHRRLAVQEVRSDCGESRRAVGTGFRERAGVGALRGVRVRAAFIGAALSRG